MKARIIAAAALLAIGASSASAREGWQKDRHPYAQKHHSACQDKAQRLHGFEVRATRDGRLSRDERRTIEVLKRDLDRTCGRYRHH
ncbi:MAG: hypothetical protein ABL901_19875 [Hyphomicrobiaceae bacterium]